MIRVIIERSCRPDKLLEIESQLTDIRTAAMKQPGYISGETLHSVDDPTLWLVISTWLDLDMWKAWEASKERRQAMKKMEPLLIVPEKVSVFSFLRRGGSASAHKIDK